jgi:hypothetical protein
METQGKIWNEDWEWEKEENVEPWDVKQAISEWSNKLEKSYISINIPENERKE